MKAQDLAQYIINRSSKGISNLELQKIMYFVVLKHYKDTGEYLLDKDFEAWQFGAIVYDVYLFYRDYGANSIDRTNENIEIEDSIKQRLDFVLSKLSNYNYWDWVGMLHAKGGAWERTYTAEKKGVIPRELIRSESYSLSVNSLAMKPQEIEHKSEAEIEAEFNAHAREVLESSLQNIETTIKIYKVMSKIDIRQPAYYREYLERANAIITEALKDIK